MKAKILFLAVAIMFSGIAYSQTVNNENNTDCEKKVLNKIQKKMQYLEVGDYLEIGQQARFIVTCRLNENKQVEVVAIRGINEELKEAIISNLKKHPVICKSSTGTSDFTFSMRFEMRPPR